ncbi:MAG: hypothetical protein WDO13_17505 [Verrucomicrobiota bacterium]
MLEPLADLDVVDVGAQHRGGQTLARGPNRTSPMITACGET